jgi:hypothetical protein
VFRAYRTGSKVDLTAFSANYVQEATNNTRRQSVRNLMRKPHRCDQLLRRLVAAKKTFKTRARKGTSGGGNNDSDDDGIDIVDRSSPPLLSDSSYESDA